MRRGEQIPIPTTLTQGHRELHRLIEQEVGLEIEDELSVPPYSIDCYSPECHLGFEFDGALYHASTMKRLRDSQRDAEILETYGIPIFRVPAEEMKKGNRKSLIDNLQAFVDNNQDTISIRLRKYRETTQGRDVL